MDRGGVGMWIEIVRHGRTARAKLWDDRKKICPECHSKLVEERHYKDGDRYICTWCGCLWKEDLSGAEKAIIRGEFRRAPQSPETVLFKKER